MKRFVATILSLTLVAGFSAFASDTQVKNLEESRYSISVGDLTMTVDAAKGGKILSFKCGESEVISQMRWPNSFGSTFWTSPQAEWNWPPVPEYDTKPFEAQVGEDNLTLKGEVSKFGYRITKQFAGDPADNAIVVSYTITNESGEERNVAPWEITRVPGAGVIFFDTPKEEVWPQDLLPITGEYGITWYQFEEKRENRKVNADGKGWLAYSNNGLLLVKKFDDLQAGEPAPGEAEVQVYVNMGTTFIEIESQGAYKHLNPGESLTWTVRWYLVPQTSETAPSQELLDTARALVNGSATAAAKSDGCEHCKKCNKH